MDIRANVDERHEYRTTLRWTGAAAGPTRSYQSYSREYEFQSPGRPAIRGSADAHFRGDASLYNPEDLLVVALATCHLLSYLADCSRAGVQVVSYADDAIGTMSVRDGKLRFTDVLLRPRVTVTPGTDLEKARRLHETAHASCYVANSVNFPVRHDVVVAVAT